MTPVPPCRPVTVLAFAGDRSRTFVALVFTALADEGGVAMAPAVPAFVLKNEPTKWAA